MTTLHPHDLRFFDTSRPLGYFLGWEEKQLEMERACGVHLPSMVMLFGDCPTIGSHLKEKMNRFLARIADIETAAALDQHHAKLVGAAHVEKLKIAAKASGLVAQYAVYAMF